MYTQKDSSTTSNVNLNESALRFQYFDYITILLFNVNGVTRPPKIIAASLRSFLYFVGGY